MLVPHEKADLSDAFVSELVDLVFAGAASPKRVKVVSVKAGARPQRDMETAEHV
jgi:hypothetical protein